MSYLQHNTCVKALGQGLVLLNNFHRRLLYTFTTNSDLCSSASFSSKSINEEQQESFRSRPRTKKIHNRMLTEEERRDNAEFLSLSHFNDEDRFGHYQQYDKILHKRDPAGMSSSIKQTETSSLTELDRVKFGNFTTKTFEKLTTLQKSSPFDKNRFNIGSSSASLKLKNENTEKKWRDKFGTLYENNNIALEKQGVENEQLHDDDDSDDKTSIRLSKYYRRNVPYWYGRQIEKFGKQKKIKEAIAVLEDWMLKRDRVKPHKYNFSVLIGVLGRVGYTKKAFQLFNQMKKMGLEADAVTYTGLFNACANSPWKDDGLQRAKHLHQLMAEKQWKPNLITGRAMIKAYGTCGDLPAAFAVMDDLSRRFELDQRCFSTLLSACLSDKENGMRLALEVWQMMLQHKIKPNIRTYNLLLQSVRDCGIGKVDNDMINQSEYTRLHSRSSNMEKVAAIDQSSDEEGHSDNYSLTVSPPSEVNFMQESSDLQQLDSLLSQIDFEAKENRLALVGGRDTFLEHIQKNGEKADIKTFSLLLDNCSQTTEAEEELLVLMTNHDVKPDQEFFNSLMRKRCLRNDLERAKEVLEKMAYHNLTPNMQTFEILAITCKSHKEGLKLLTSIEEMGSQPSKEIYNGLIQASGLNFFYKTDMVQRMEMLDIKPDLELIKTIEKDIQSAKYLIARQESRKINKFKNLPSMQEGFKKFMIYYTAWLKRSEISESEHPWSSFIQDKDR